MVDYLTHYYRRGTKPFRSLSALPDPEAIEIMQQLSSDNILWERFKDPVDYLRNRRQTEKWVREQFILKGGRPREEYPIYMVLGTSAWVEKNAPLEEAATIRIPLSALQECDVSFTYPDSMISFWIGRDKPAVYYLAEYHGKIFTSSEIINIVDKYGLPEGNWKTNLPEGLAPYIEAQVWNQMPLRGIYDDCIDEQLIRREIHNCD